MQMVPVRRLFWIPKWQTFKSSYKIVFYIYILLPFTLLQGCDVLNPLIFSFTSG